jgi:hypothetical protein
VRICGSKILRTMIGEQRSWITVSSRCIRSVDGIARETAFHSGC